MSDPIPSKTVPGGPSWHRGKAMAIAAFVAVAFAGVLSGAALDRYVLYLWSRPEARPPGPFPGGRRGGPPDGGRFGGRGGPPEIPRLMRALDLSPAQQEGIDSMLDRQGKKLQQVRERIRPEIDSLVAETEREVEARLTPDQRTRYIELRSEMRRGRGRRGGPPR